MQYFIVHAEEFTQRIHLISWQYIGVNNCSREAKQALILFHFIYLLFKYIYSLAARVLQYLYEDLWFIEHPTS